MTGQALRALSVDPQALSRQARSMITATMSAVPMIYGSRAWRLWVAHGAFELHADVRQWQPAGQSAHRRLRLASGMALFNLRLAVAALGREPVTALLPDPDRAELQAVVRMAGETRRPLEWRRLYAALWHPASLRPPASDHPVPPMVRHALRRAAELEGGWLTVIDSGPVGTRLRELVWPAGVDHPGDALDGAPQRGFGWEADPVLAVLSSFHDLPVGHLRSGQAMQRMALTAASYGLTTEFLPDPLAAPGVRAALGKLLGHRLYPQMVLAVGPAVLRAAGRRVTG